MATIKTYEGDLVIRDAKVCLVVSRFNSFIVEQLESGAIDALVRHGADRDDITVVRVPGAFELPLAVQKVAEMQQFDAIIAKRIVRR